jgi:hypothetical protein
MNAALVGINRCLEAGRYIRTQALFRLHLMASNPDTLTESGIMGDMYK